MVGLAGMGCIAAVGRDRALAGMRVADSSVAAGCKWKDAGIGLCWHCCYFLRSLHLY